MIADYAQTGKGEKTEQECSRRRKVYYKGMSTKLTTQLTKLYAERGAGELDADVEGGGVAKNHLQGLYKLYVRIDGIAVCLYLDLLVAVFRYEVEIKRTVPFVFDEKFFQFLHLLFLHG